MDAAGLSATRAFRPMRIVVAVLIGLLAVSAFAQWYAGAVSLPRYCQDQTGTLLHLERILAEDQPAGDGSRRPYVVAAKLLFLMPREAGEGAHAYLARVRRQLEEQCR